MWIQTSLLDYIFPSFQLASSRTVNKQKLLDHIKNFYSFDFISFSTLFLNVMVLQGSILTLLLSYLHTLHRGWIICCNALNILYQSHFCFHSTYPSDLHTFPFWHLKGFSSVTWAKGNFCSLIPCFLSQRLASGPIWKTSYHLWCLAPYTPISNPATNKPGRSTPE